MTGYCDPPASGKFRKNEPSRNPYGRPKNHVVKAPYEDVLGMMIAVRDSDGERLESAETAFLENVVRRGLGDNSTMAILANEALELEMQLRGANESPPPHINVVFVPPQNECRPAWLFHTFDQYDHDKRRTVLLPWIVEEALARFGDRRLTVEEQRIVLASMRMPHKVRWPDWWTELPDGGWHGQQRSTG